MKARGCAVCKRPDRARIEALRAGGVPLRAIAERFGLTGKDAVHYHFKNHVTPERRASLMIGPAQWETLSNQAAQESRTLLERMNVATSILFKRFVACAEAGADYALVGIAGKLNALFRDYAELTGQLREISTSVTINQNTINLIASPEFVALQSGLLAIVRAHPDARADIIGLLRSLEAKPEAPTAAPMIECGAADAAA
jgi:hypothetical protein